MNTQKPERPSLFTSSKLDVHSIFYTIQGEGPFAGEPAVFIRLAGCNIMCPGCDTDYTDGRNQMRVEDIVECLTLYSRAKDKLALVVISGGEPFRQDLSLLVDLLLLKGYIVQIETNGTLAPSLSVPQLLNERVVIVCAPKTSKVNDSLLPFVDAFKYVIEHRYVNLENGLPLRVLGLKAKPFYPPEDFDGIVYVQPMDSQNERENKANLSCAIRSAKMYGHRLCVQLHKIIGVE